MLDMLKDSDRLTNHIRQVAGEDIAPQLDLPTHGPELADASAVLFLLGPAPARNGCGPEPSLILNKRSDRVRQPGDLCCPGGGVMPAVDAVLSKTMTWPGFPMRRWPYWSKMKAEHPAQADALRFLFFTSLRESFEEMRLNPFGIDFLGPLPPQQLSMFRKTIYPMMGWLPGQKRFFPNWEVEKIVTIPLRKLLDPQNYVRYRLYVEPLNGEGERRLVYDSPSYRHRNDHEKEILWGATCRITLKFLSRIFDFSLPDSDFLPVVEDVMDQAYANAD